MIDPTTWTPPALVTWIKEEFERRNLPGSNRLEAEYLVAHALNMKRLDLFLNFDRPTSKDERERLKDLLKRRFQREPLAYLLGNAHFWTLELFVGPGVLVPRSDTETLVEAMLKYLPKEGPLNLLEVGAGSLAISLALAVERPNTRIYAFEISQEACEWANKNLAKYQNELVKGGSEIKLLEQDAFEGNWPREIGQLDGIFSNPPYVAQEEWQKIEPEVQKYEPEIALIAAEEGLSCYPKLAELALRFLLPGGILGFEHGATQQDLIEQRLKGASGLRLIEKRTDLSGHPRVMVYKKEG